LTITGNVPAINETSGIYEIDNVESTQGVANGSNIQFNIDQTISPLINVFDTEANVSISFYNFLHIFKTYLFSIYTSFFLI